MASLTRRWRIFSTYVVVALTMMSASHADPRVVSSKPAAVVPPATLDDLTVQFAPDPEHNRVSLLLAESQVRVRLGHDLLLRCEVSSHDETNADAELKFDLGVQFKFK